MAVDHGCSNPNSKQQRFYTLWPCDLNLFIFDLIFIDGRGIMMDDLSAKFGDFSFSRFGFIVRTDRITESQTDADDRYIHATTVSNYPGKSRIHKKEGWRLYIFCTADACDCEWVINTPKFSSYQGGGATHRCNLRRYEGTGTPLFGLGYHTLLFRRRSAEIKLQ